MQPTQTGTAQQAYQQHYDNRAGGAGQQPVAPTTHSPEYKQSLINSILTSQNNIKELERQLVILNTNE